MGVIEPLSLGFIGGGLSSAIGETHYSASRMDGRWRVDAGVFSRYQDVNQETARAWGVDQGRVYEDLKTFMDREHDRLDAVVLLTPTPDHGEALKLLSTYGTPVICEKAMVSSVDDGRAVAERFNAQNGYLAVTYNYSGYPMVRELRELVRTGALGDIRHIQFEMPQEGFARPPMIAGKPAPPQPWRLKDQEIPTICLDLGVHLHHLFEFITGHHITHVSGKFDNYSQYKGLVDHVMMMVRFAGEGVGSFWLSKTAIGMRNGLRVRLFGSKGSAEWFQMQPEELRLSFEDGSFQIMDRGGNATIAKEHRYNRMKAGHPAGFIEAFANLYADMADALMAYRETGTLDHPYVYGHDHALRGLEIFQAARWSNENNGAWQAL